MNMALMVMTPSLSLYLPVLVNSYSQILRRTCIHLVEVEREGVIRGQLVKEVAADPRCKEAKRL